MECPLPSGPKPRTYHVLAQWLVTTPARGAYARRWRQWAKSIRAPSSAGSLGRRSHCGPTPRRRRHTHVLGGGTQCVCMYRQMKNNRAGRCKGSKGKQALTGRQTDRQINAPPKRGTDWPSHRRPHTHLTRWCTPSWTHCHAFRTYRQGLSQQAARTGGPHGLKHARHRRGRIEQALDLARQPLTRATQQREKLAHRHARSQAPVKHANRELPATRKA